MEKKLKKVNRDKTYFIKRLSVDEAELADFEIVRKSCHENHEINEIILVSGSCFSKRTKDNDDGNNQIEIDNTCEDLQKLNKLTVKVLKERLRNKEKGISNKRRINLLKLTVEHFLIEKFQKDNKE
jgi:hypothetical protein